MTSRRTRILLLAALVLTALAAAGCSYMNIIRTRVPPPGRQDNGNGPLHVRGARPST